MSEKTITDGLFALKDENYRRFHAKLIPDIPIDNIIGVRTPVLRKYAKEVAKLPEANIFLESLPHIYYEENNLHVVLTLSKRYNSFYGTARTFFAVCR